MYVSSRFFAVDQGNDVGMMEAFENVDLGVEVVFELFIESVDINRLDSYKAGFLLQE